MDKSDKIIVGISIGDLNGIGVEVILKTFQDNRMLDFCTPLIFASTKTISYHKKALNLEIPIHGITSLSQIQHTKINVLNIWKEDVSVTLGKASKESGDYAAKSLEIAVDYLKNKKIDVLVTAPINKETIQSEDFNFPGHTEYLEDKLEGESLMILMNDFLRIGLITGHIPISKIAETITPELIESKVKILNQSLKKDFNINKPKIAVLGLNPHSGDNGVIGQEENEMIKPTITSIHEKGIFVYGPYAADGFFGSEAYKQFDGVLAMYHDQGLPVLKYQGFGRAANITLGLPIVRTSVDHGTALDLAGTAGASNGSMVTAIEVALQMTAASKGAH